MERVLILNEQSDWLPWSVNFEGQFEDGLSVSDSLCTAAPSPQNKSEKGCLWGRGRLCTGQSQTDNPFLALVWKQLMTKFPCSVFLMIAKDSTERPSAIALSKALLLRAANAFRMTWSERIFSSDTPPKCLHRDCVGRRRTGTRHGNVYLSVREKQGIVVYRLCVLQTVTGSLHGCCFTSTCISKARPPENRKF